MKTSFRIILVISLVANIAFGMLWMRKRAELAEGVVNERGAISAAAPRDGVVVESGNSGGSEMAGESDRIYLNDPWEAAQWARAEGFPEWVVRNIVSSLASRKYGVDLIEERFPRPRPKEVQALLNQAVAAGRIEAMDINDPDQVRLRYGDLSVEKISAVQELEALYVDATDHVFASALESVLTPPEIESYIRLNSLLARNLQSLIANQDIDEATYSALWEAAVERTGTPTPDQTSEELRHDLLGGLDDFRQILGDERFLQMAWQVSSRIAETNLFYESIGMPAALQAELFIQAFDAMQEAENLRSGAMWQAARDAYDAIVARANFTPEQLAAFDETTVGGLARNPIGVNGGAVSNRL